jgi:hypothetical protein
MDSIKREVSELVQSGHFIRLREVFAIATPDEREAAACSLGKPARDDEAPEAESKTQASEESDETLRKVLEDATGPSRFKRDYQSWYSKALRVVRQVLPDRYDEFRSYYEQPRRKDITVSTYTVGDYVAGLTVTGWDGKPTFNAHHVATGHFETQIEILSSAKDLLESRLEDITAVIKAGLLDTELESASNLLKASHLRSAGVVAGVVLESHLQAVLKAHSIALRKKPTLGALNDALKDGGVIDVPTWRKLQYLADVRNVCAHKGDRDPRHEEVNDLIEQVTKFIHTVH